MSSEYKEKYSPSISRGEFIKFFVAAMAGFSWWAWLLRKKDLGSDAIKYVETPTPTPRMTPSNIPKNISSTVIYEPASGTTQEPTILTEREVTSSPTVSPETKELEQKIERYGKAEAIVSFEFHGDNYNIYPGYSMNPVAFERQMDYLADNDYYPVKGDQLVSFLNGKIDLPVRSVILTTDSGNVSVKSVPRMIPVLKETGMHFLSFIHTLNMDEGESVLCKDNAAWKAFESAVSAGVFSIGCHSQTHRDFNLISSEEGLHELKLSKEKIENILGIPVFGLSWPFESVPTWADQLKDIGYEYAFGGRTRSILNCSVFYKDDFKYKLPRIFPPNPSGISGRPNNYTLEEILQTYSR